MVWFRNCMGKDPCQKKACLFRRIVPTPSVCIIRVFCEKVALGDGAEKVLIGGSFRLLYYVLNAFIVRKTFAGGVFP